MSRGPGSNDPRDNDDYVLGRDGKPLVDRYGRPVRRRQAQKPASESSHRHVSRDPHPPAQQSDQTRIEGRSEGRSAGRPRQQFPPERPRQRYQPRRAPYEERRREQQVPMHVSEPPRRRGGQQRNQPRNPRRRRGGRLGCGGIIAVLLVAVLLFGFWMDARFTRVDAFPDAPIGNTAGTNWLLVGSDSREGLSEEEAQRLGTGGDLGNGRTDTIMILHIPTFGESSLISVPRDSLVTIPGYGENKINAAFAFGGPKLLSETIEQETGLRIDHYAEIGMGGLAGIVDAIGGLELCPAEAIQDPLANLDVQAGCQEMDGVTALGYVRTRATAQGDLDRVERQREFFSALMSKVSSPGTFLNPIRMTSLAFTGTKLLVIGEGDHLWHLARLALAMVGGVKSETVPIGGNMDSYVGAVLLWDEVAAEELFSSMR
ncbi:LCP family protein [Corynebacterium lubricantis]|uniref:LCP family protein n=1 Tax=Corynebacterium lubricantis TaxID=541095 RepID=UPI0009FCAEA7|nr:LCP family protein [Corynebacterium lubricantis]